MTGAGRQHKPSGLGQGTGGPGRVTILKTLGYTALDKWTFVSFVFCLFVRKVDVYVQSPIFFFSSMRVNHNGRIRYAFWSLLWSLVLSQILQDRLRPLSFFDFITISCITLEKLHHP